MRSREEIQKEIEFNQRIQLEAAQERSRTSASGIIRIGDRDGATGRWQALTAQGIRQGIKTFNTSVPAGTLVRGIPTPSGLVALDRENIIGSPPDPEVLTPVSWVRVWVTEQQQLVRGELLYINVSETAYFQVKGKSAVPLVSSFGSTYPFSEEVLGNEQSNLELAIVGVSVITPSLVFVELNLYRQTTTNPALDGPFFVVTNRTSYLRYVIKDGVRVTQLPSHSYVFTNFDSPIPQPALPIPLDSYDDYINRDPFNASGFRVNDPRFPRERQVYPQARRYHAYFAKELFYADSYALPPGGLGREINELSETVQGSGPGAKYYTWVLAIAPSKIEEYIRRSSLNDQNFWNKVLGWGGKVPASLGKFVRTGSDPEAIAPLTGLSGADDGSSFYSKGLAFFSKYQDSAIVEVYEVSPSIPPSYALSAAPLPFYSIPGFARKVGQVPIDFSDPRFTERSEFVSQVSGGAIDFVNYTRTRQVVLKVII